jgi:hypothetical protein
VHWLTDDAHHPSSGASEIILRNLEIAGDQERVDEYLGTSASQPLDGVEVEWLDASEDETGVVAATFATANGAIRID